MCQKNFGVFFHVTTKCEKEVKNNTFQTSAILTPGFWYLFSKIKITTLLR